MVRYLGAVLLAGLVTLAVGRSEDKGKPPPEPFAGTWEYMAKGKPGEFLPMRTFQFSNGKMLFIEPRNPMEPGKRTGCRIEAEYAVSSEGRVYGVIMRYSGQTDVDEGDTFSFLPKVGKEDMILSEPKGFLRSLPGIPTQQLQKKF